LLLHAVDASADLAAMPEVVDLDLEWTIWIQAWSTRTRSPATAATSWSRCCGAGPSAACGSTPASSSWQLGAVPAERRLARRVAGAVTYDPATNERYFGYAREGRAALWVHVPEDADARRAVRGLADHKVLHFRHYGHGSQQDLHIG
jgi:hypothetical protein